MKSEKNRERPNSVVGFYRYFLVVLTAFAFATVPTVVVAAEEVEGISKLGINIPGLIAQLVNFLILLVVLKIFLWGPILKVLDERKRRIEEGLNRAEQAASDALATEEEAKNALSFPQRWITQHQPKASGARLPTNRADPLPGVDVLLHGFGFSLSC